MEKKFQKMCFTIGHSNHSIENFVKILKKWKIECLIDIRSIPYSKHAKQFNKEELIKQVLKNGLQYRYLGNKVGGGIIRFHNSSQNTPKLKELLRNEKFISGIKIIHTFILKNKKVALMCSEKDPFTCHRFFLVSNSLQKKKVKINHILYNGDVIKNKVLENKLKDSNSQKSIVDFNQKEVNIEDLYEQHYLHIYKKFSE